MAFKDHQQHNHDPDFETIFNLIKCSCFIAALGGLVLATEPTGYSVAGSSPTEDGGFLWVIKIPSTHFLRRGSKAVGPMS
jgi:hypothetical protein